MKIITEYPAWLIIFCILLGLLVAGILYYKNEREEFSRKLSLLLAVLRFLAVTLIAFLLLNPMVKSYFRNLQKPIIIVAQDNSSSILTGPDSTYYKTEYPDQLRKLLEKLEREYEVKTYSFGEKVSEGLLLTFNERQTDISELFNELVNRFANRNVGALILASDGVYNKGISPVYSGEKIRFPVYTVALGDTSIRKDLFLRKVNFNRIVFKGNQFPVEIVVGANLSQGLSSVLTISKGGATLFSQNISFKTNYYNETIMAYLTAEQAGLQRYTVAIKPIDGEISLDNNQEDIFIEVLDTKQKILLLYQSPHPDIGALKSAIESNIANEVKDSPAGEFTGNINEYNLLIFHQLPGGNNNISRLITEAQRHGVPILYILGAQSDINSFNTLGAGLQIFSEKALINEALPAYNKDFALFTLSNETLRTLTKFPPLNVPFGDIKTSVSANILFYQQIGSLVSDFPLIMFTQTPDNKTGIIAGEGLWRWRISNYQQNQNHDAFNEVVSKIIQYMAIKVDKSYFRIIGRNNFLENEPIILDAEVYNQSYELINTPEIEIKITGSNGETYPFTFSRTTNAYQLNAGFLPVDHYSYEASVKVGDKIYRHRGEFTVSPLNIEAINTIADHNLLYRLALQHDGEMIYPGQLNELPSLLKKRDDIRTLIYSEKQLSDLLNLFWIFLIILTFLGAEWLLRKRSGSY